MTCRNRYTGDCGEEAAAGWLRMNGFEICARNWRAGRYEIDIVARQGDTLHFVEVKTRRVGSLTAPEAAITLQKIGALQKAAEAFLMQWPEASEVQFDLAAVDWASDGAVEIRFIENAMEFHW